MNFSDRLSGDLESDKARLKSMREATNSAPMLQPVFMDKIRAIRRLARAIEKAERKS
jgi:hypothetical protein